MGCGLCSRSPCALCPSSESNPSILASVSLRSGMGTSLLPRRSTSSFFPPSADAAAVPVLKAVGINKGLPTGLATICLVVDGGVALPLLPPPLAPVSSSVLLEAVLMLLLDEEKLLLLIPFNLATTLMAKKVLALRALRARSTSAAVGSEKVTQFSSYEGRGVVPDEVSQGSVQSSWIVMRVWESLSRRRRRRVESEGERVEGMVGLLSRDVGRVS